MADERPQYTTVAKTKNYWMSPQALNITLNARNEANRIAAGVASGARFFCHFKDIGDPQAEALFGYDVGHNFCSWPLIISPTYFYTDDVIYPHIAIPRIDRGNSQAMVVFPTKELDLWGYEVEEVPMQDEEGNYIDDDGNIVDDPEDAATAYIRVKLPGTETDADPVGSDEFYYIYLHGMLTEPFYSGGMLIRQWSPEIDTGRLNTDETWGEAVTLEELAREMKKKVDVDWFKRLFTIHGTNRTKPDEDDEDDDNQLYPGEISTGDGEEEDDEEWEGDDTPREVQPNDMEHEITDIEMMFGAWTEHWLSALGQGSGGGGGGAMLNDPLMSINSIDRNPTTVGQTLVWKGANSGINGSGWDFGTAGMDESALAQYLYNNNYMNEADLLTYSWWGRQFTANSKVIKGDIENTGNIIPETSGASDIGASALRYKAIYVNEIYVGDAKISWDSTNRGLHVTKGIYSDEWVAALGAGSSGGGGGAMLNDPLMSINSIDRNPTTVGQTLVWKGANSGINRSGWDFGNAGMDETALANYLSSHNYMNETDLLTYSWWGRQFTANSKVIKGDIENTGNIIPETTNASDIGTSALRYKAVYVNEIYVGDAKISWDSQNHGLHITKGMYSDEWVSALGTGSSGSGGGTPLNALLLSLNNASIVPTGQTNTVLVNNNGTWRWEAYGGGGSSTMSWLDITDKPTTLAGYGITDAVSTAATWWGRQISNDVVTGPITLDNGDELKWKVPGGSSMYSMIEMEYTNQREQFYLGKDALTFTCDTIVRGSTLTLEAGTTAATHSASLAADGTFTVEKLRIGGTNGIVISHDTQNGGLHVESAGLYADTFISALGTGSSSGGSGGSVVYGLSLSSGTLSLVPDGGTQSVNLGNSFVTLSGNQTVSGTKKFASIHADTVYLGGSDTDCFLNRNGNNLILQNNRSAGTVILAGNANEPTYRKLGSGSSYTDNLILHSGSLNLDGSNNLTGITVGGTTYNISSGGGGGDVSSITLTNGGTNLQPTNGIITLPASTASEYGIVKVVNVLSSSPNVNSNTGSAVRNYGVQLRADGVAFVHVPWEDNDTKNTTGTGVTQSASKYYLVGATEQSSDGVQTYTQANCYMKSGLLYSDGNKVATETWVSNKGYANTSDLANYLPLTGGTLTGALTIGSSTSDPKDLSLIGTLKTTENIVAINFRPDHQQYNSKIEYMTDGDEALVWANQNAVTSFIFKSGLDLSNTSNWTTITPSLQIKGQSVYINSLIRNGITPSYNFHVNGSSYLGGKVGIGGAPSNFYLLQVSGKIHADDNIETDESFVGSDMRRKDVVSIITDEDFDLENIARAPLFRFIWNDKEDKSLHVGTSAQYWQTLLPELITTGANDRLYQDYAATALAAAITIARKVMTHEEEIAALQKRVDAVEKENERLRTEIEQLKAA